MIGVNGIRTHSSEKQRADRMRMPCDAVMLRVAHRHTSFTLSKRQRDTPQQRALSLSDIDAYRRPQRGTSATASVARAIRNAIRACERESCGEQRQSGLCAPNELYIAHNAADRGRESFSGRRALECYNIKVNEWCYVLHCERKRKNI